MWVKLLDIVGDKTIIVDYLFLGRFLWRDVMLKLVQILFEISIRPNIIKYYNEY